VVAATLYWVQRGATLFYDASLCELCLCYANTFLHVASKLIFAAAIAYPARPPARFIVIGVNFFL